MRIPRRAAHPRDIYVTPLDIELLSAVEATGNIVEACARISMGRDAGMYRLRRLTRALATPVVVSVRGGSARGGTSLTEAGRHVLIRGAGPLRTSPRGKPGRPLGVNVLRGTWRSAPQPHVALGGGLILFVTFAAREGESVRVAIEPEAIVVARSRFRSSARNVMPGTVRTVRRVDSMRAVLRVGIGEGAWLDVAITPRSESLLRLRAGARVFLYLKATAVARLP
jgi:molybdopterin-binding protein/molybdate transport repressor ModE-like protein